MNEYDFYNTKVYIIIIIKKIYLRINLPMIYSIYIYQVIYFLKYEIKK